MCEAAVRSPLATRKAGVRRQRAARIKRSEVPGDDEPSRSSTRLAAHADRIIQRTVSHKRQSHCEDWSSQPGDSLAHRRERGARCPWRRAGLERTNAEASASVTARYSYAASPNSTLAGAVSLAINGLSAGSASSSPRTLAREPTRLSFAIDLAGERRQTRMLTGLRLRDENSACRISPGPGIPHRWCGSRSRRAVKLASHKSMIRLTSATVGHPRRMPIGMALRCLGDLKLQVETTRRLRETQTWLKAQGLGRFRQAPDRCADA